MTRKTPLQKWPGPGPKPKVWDDDTWFAHSMRERYIAQRTARRKSARERARRRLDPWYGANRVERRRKEALAPSAKYVADRETVQMSYREALARVEDLTDRDRLTSRLERAEMVGDDDVLAKAVLQRGYELQDERVVGSYLKKYPDQRERWDRFMGAAQGINELERGAQVFGDQGPQKPRELAGPGPAPALDRSA